MSSLPARDHTTGFPHPVDVPSQRGVGLALAERFLDHVEAEGQEVKLLMHDRDTKFTTSFDEVFREAQGEAKKTAFHSPTTNAYVERFIQTLQQEVLDSFVVFGTQHLDHLVSEMVEHYHEERPHQAMDNGLLVLKCPPSGDQEAPPSTRKVVVQGASRRRAEALLFQGRVGSRGCRSLASTLGDEGCRCQNGVGLGWPPETPELPLQLPHLF